MNRLLFLRPSLLFFILFALFSCTVSKLKTDGVYVHKFKGGHDRRITIINDSLLRYENNVSMMFFDITIPYTIENNRIKVFQGIKDTLDETSKLSYPPVIIDIENQRTLSIDNLVFRFKKI